MILFVLFSLDVLINELLSLPEAAEHDLYLDFYDKNLPYLRYHASIQYIPTPIF